VHAVAACPGLLVVDAAIGVIASNNEAIRILGFPDQLDNVPDNWLSQRIRVRLVDGPFLNPPRFCAEFRSGKRTYICRSFSVRAEAETRTNHRPSLVILLERKTNHTVSMSELCEHFGLTAREQETVQLLLQGLTSKEIGRRMGISPNTVKAFIRLVMVKMKVSTRSGIIGKIVGPRA
jgi:DNA-binding CsgD family transcriptional regulator